MLLLLQLPFLRIPPYTLGNGELCNWTLVLVGSKRDANWQQGLKKKGVPEISSTSKSKIPVGEPGPKQGLHSWGKKHYLLSTGLLHCRKPSVPNPFKIWAYLSGSTCWYVCALILDLIYFYIYFCSCQCITLTLLILFCTLDRNMFDLEHLPYLLNVNKFVHGT